MFDLFEESCWEERNNSCHNVCPWKSFDTYIDDGELFVFVSERKCSTIHAIQQQHQVQQTDDFLSYLFPYENNSLIFPR